MERIENFYNKHYKKLMIIPLTLLIISLILVLNFYSKNDDFFKKDVSLSGGVTLSLYLDKDVNADEIESYLQEQFPKSDFFIRKLSEFGTEKQTGIIIEASEIKGNELKDIVGKKLDIKYSEDNFSLEETGSSLGSGFYRQMLMAMLWAFIFIGIVVFIIFRTIIPSLAILLGVITDITVTIAVIDLLGIRIGTAGIAALLLLIGYSIDDNILITTRTIKQREAGGFFKGLVRSGKTGLTMAFTTIVTIIVAILITKSFVLEQMFTIMLIGLVIDLLTTYFTNAGILKWYCKRKGWD